MGLSITDSVTKHYITNPCPCSNAITMQMSRSCRVSYLSASALVRYGLTSRYRSARYVAYHLGDPEYWNSVSTATDMYVELFHAHRSSAVFCGLAVELERQINWQPLALGSFQSNAHKKGMVLIRANGVNMLYTVNGIECVRIWYILPKIPILAIWTQRIIRCACVWSWRIAVRKQ